MMDIYPKSWIPQFMNRAKQMDVFLYFTGGIHFVMRQMPPCLLGARGLQLLHGLFIIRMTEICKCEVKSTICMHNVITAY